MLLSHTPILAQSLQFICLEMHSNHIVDFVQVMWISCVSSVRAIARQLPFPLPKQWPELSLSYSILWGETRSIVSTSHGRLAVKTVSLCAHNIFDKYFCVCSLAANIEAFYVWYYKCSSGPCFHQNETIIDLPYFEKGRKECLPIHSTVSC